VGAAPHHIHNLHLSPDEKSVAFDYMESNDVYTYDFAKKNLLRFTFDKHSHSAIFTPDGKRIIYASGLAPHSEIWNKSVDGTGQAAQLFDATSISALPDSISPDGTTLAYHETFAQTGGDIFLASLRGEAKPHSFLKTEADEREATFSPDGKFIAYESNESGLSEIYERSVTGSGVWQISNEETRAPRWAKDGKKLYYVADGSRLMAIDVSTNGSSFSFSNPRLLFEAVDFFHGGYDVTRDGHFIWARLSPNSSIKQLRVIENFDAEISRKAVAAQP
jgi:Tol biopolymer transport system component